MTQQNSLFDTAINRAIKVLENTGCQFTVITPDGKQIGEIKTRKAKSEYRKGDVLNHVLPHIEKIKAGEIGFVPFGDFQQRSVASSLSSYCSRNWGLGSYTYETVDGGLSILRVL